MDLSAILKKYSNNKVIAYLSTIDTPLGVVIAIADQDFLYMVNFENSKNIGKTIQSIAGELSCRFVNEKNEILIKFESELNEYFKGKLRKFTIPIKTLGSEFQNDVWNKLMEVPYGSTQSYGDLAKDLGRPSSHSRAVGAACGANAHLIVVPCHRLVSSGSAGKGGFSSGVDRKEWLIEHEKKFIS